jgi:hypothetical protein
VSTNRKAGATLTEDRLFAIFLSVLIADIYAPLFILFILKIWYRQSFLRYTWRASAKLIRRKKYRQTLETDVRHLANCAVLASRMGDYPLAKMRSLRIRHLLMRDYRAMRGRNHGLLFTYVIAALPYYIANEIAPMIDRPLREAMNKARASSKVEFDIIYGPGLAVQLGGLLCSLLLIVFAFWSWLRKRRVDSEGGALRAACALLELAGWGKKPLTSPARVDLDVANLCNWLRLFSAYGNPGGPAIRRAQLNLHVTQVIGTLEDASEQILMHGEEAYVHLVTMLSKMIDRMVEGRWHGLLDESEMSARARLMKENVIPHETKRDIRIAVFGALLAATFAVGSVLLGVPSEVALSVAGITALIPAAVSGGKRFGLSPADFLGHSRQSFTAGQGVGPQGADAPAPPP